MSFFKPVDVFSFFPCQTEDFARLPLAITLTFMAFFIGVFFMTFTFFIAFTFMAIFFTSTFLQIVWWLEQVLSQIGFPPNCWERLGFEMDNKIRQHQQENLYIQASSSSQEPSSQSTS